MNAAVRRRLAPMGRAGLLAGILAIVAGILGMHILTGNHCRAHAGSRAAVVVRRSAARRARSQPAQPWRAQR